ncbi:MAG TPA: hypothetical protein VI278_04900 [Nitrososphaeraceae archaeon]
MPIFLPKEQTISSPFGSIQHLALLVTRGSVNLSSADSKMKKY